MTIRTVCFDFQDTLAYFADTHLGLYVQAAAEHGVDVTAGALGKHVDDAWAQWRTPQGLDHAAASRDEPTYSALRLAVHRNRFRAVGVEGGAADAIAERVLELESDPGHYRLYDDTVPALERLAAAGAEAMIVSNHIWRLPEIVDALGIGSRLRAVLTSARVGYRKPHPAIYAEALRCAGRDPAEVLFVGDNAQADVAGPRAAGMRSVLLDREGAHGAGDADGDAIRSLLEVPLGEAPRQ